MACHRCSGRLGVYGERRLSGRRCTGEALSSAVGFTLADRSSPPGACLAASSTFGLSLSPPDGEGHSGLRLVPLLAAYHRLLMDAKHADSGSV